MTSKLQFITNGDTPVETVRQAVCAILGGCHFVQVRMKNADDDIVATVLNAIMPMARLFDTTVVVDDRVSLVPLCDGVHLGRNDMPVDEARTLIGNDKLIGVTINDETDITRLAEQKFDSIGLGPWRFTRTKSNLAPCLGRDGVGCLIEKIRTQGIDVPIYVIGGVDIDDVDDILAVGGSGVAISGAIISATDPVNMTKQFIKRLEQNNID